jgi:hypothetical protein
MLTEDLIIDKDILMVQTQSSKSDYQTSASVVLASGRYNYQSKLNPGDHIFIWMGDDLTNLIALKENLKNGDSCNDKESGLKFYGRVTSVRTNYSTQSTGVKTTRYNLSLSGFSEFGATIYYNPLLYDPSFDGKSQVFAADNFIAGVSAKWRSLIFPLSGAKTDDYLSSQSFVDFFIDVFLGEGPKRKKAGSVKKTSSTAFLIPKRVAEVFGADSSAVYFSDVFYRLLGIQNTDGSQYYPIVDQDPQRSTVFKSKNKVVGNMLTPPDSFDSTIWSLIDNYKNGTLNECYNTLKLNVDDTISPHFILRQIPFNTDKYIADTFSIKGKNGLKEQQQISHTKFSTLPIWNISPTWPVYSFNIGNSDASRFNFFSVFAHYTATDTADPNLPKLWEQYQSIAEGNLEDYERDIERSGPRNMITTAYTNFINFNNKFGPATWTRMISDWYKNGHLKLNGSINCAGISLPICVGDNLQVANKLLHIEAVSHSYTQDENGGSRSFSSSISLSRGISVDSSLDSKEIKDIQNQFSSGISSESE